MEEASKLKVIDEHNVIDDAIRDGGEGYTVFSIVGYIPIFQSLYFMVNLSSLLECYTAHLRVNSRIQRVKIISGRPYVPPNSCIILAEPVLRRNLLQQQMRPMHSLNSLASRNSRRSAKRRKKEIKKVTMLG